MPFDTLPGRTRTPVRLALTNTTEQTLIAAPGTGSHLVVYGLYGSNEGASLSRMDLKDGSTSLFSFAMAANGGGFALPFSAGWHLTGNTALKAQQSAAVNSFVMVQYEVVSD